jgi:hypothetical protein
VQLLLLFLLLLRVMPLPQEMLLPNVVVAAAAPICSSTEAFTRLITQPQ